MHSWSQPSGERPERAGCVLVRRNEDNPRSWIGDSSGPRMPPGLSFLDPVSGLPKRVGTSPRLDCAPGTRMNFGLPDEQETPRSGGPEKGDGNRCGPGRTLRAVAAVRVPASVPATGRASAGSNVPPPLGSGQIHAADEPVGPGPRPRRHRDHVPHEVPDTIVAAIGTSRDKPQRSANAGLMTGRP